MFANAHFVSMSSMATVSKFGKKWHDKTEARVAPDGAGYSSGKAPKGASVVSSSNYMKETKAFKNRIDQRRAGEVKSSPKAHSDPLEAFNIEEGEDFEL